MLKTVTSASQLDNTLTLGAVSTLPATYAIGLWVQRQEGGEGSEGNRAVPITPYKNDSKRHVWIVYLITVLYSDSSHFVFN